MANKIKKTIIAVLVALILFFSVGCGFMGLVQEKENGKSLLEKLEGSNIGSTNPQKNIPKANTTKPTGNKKAIDYDNITDLEKFILELKPKDFYGKDVQSLQDLDDTYTYVKDLTLDNGQSVILFNKEIAQPYTTNETCTYYFIFHKNMVSLWEKAVFCSNSEEMTDLYNTFLNVYVEYFGKPENTEEFFEKKGEAINSVWTTNETTLYWDLGDEFLLLEMPVGKATYYVSVGVLQKDNLPVPSTNAEDMEYGIGGPINSYDIPNESQSTKTPYDITLSGLNYEHFLPNLALLKNIAFDTASEVDGSNVYSAYVNVLGKKGIMKTYSAESIYRTDYYINTKNLPEEKDNLSNTFFELRDMTTALAGTNPQGYLNGTEGSITKESVASILNDTGRAEYLWEEETGDYVLIIEVTSKNKDGYVMIAYNSYL